MSLIGSASVMPLLNSYFHVQAIMLAIDQYAETALGNREYFLNRPHGIGGRSDNIP